METINIYIILTDIVADDSAENFTDNSQTIPL